VRWPKALAVDDWFFLDPGGNRNKVRTRPWNELGVRPGHADLTEIEDRLRVKLPADFRRYIEDQKTLSISRGVLFHADELYVVEAPGTGKQLLAFGLARDGSPFVFDVDESARSTVSPVFLLDRETGKLERQADSFSEWVKARMLLQ
jgi:hypothetical protein